MSIRSLIFLILIISSGCSPIVMIYGLKKPKLISEKKILRLTNKMNIEPADVFELDTSFFSYIYSLDTVYSKKTIKNHIQPLQALYFNENEELESYQINCYAGGIPNLKWERNNIMSVFPPKLQAPLDSLLTVEIQTDYLVPLSSSKAIEMDKNEYIVFVYWSRFMGRQSKRFIKVIQKNKSLSQKENIRIIYVNTDNLYMKSDFF